jgi:hypothetical protein
MAHALLLRDVLKAVRGAAACIRCSGLGMAGGFSHHRQALEVSSEIQSSSLEKVNMLDCSSRGFCDDVLVTKKRAGTNGILSMAAVVGFLDGC